MLLLVLLIMPINWFLEAIKWKFIASKHDIKMSFKEAYASVFFGACAGLVSPGRWGEPLARAYYLGKENYLQKVTLNFIGIISQWIITILFFLSSYLINNSLEISFSYLLTFFLVAILFIFFFIYERIINFIIKYIPLLSSKQLTNSSNNDKFIVFVITLFRYLTYSVQYLLLFVVFIGWSHSILIITKVFQLFFYQSFSPFPGLVDFALKNNIALNVFKNLGMNVIEIVFIVVSIWIINLLIPSLIGYVLFTQKIKLFLKEKY